MGTMTTPKHRFDRQGGVVPVTLAAAGAPWDQLAALKNVDQFAVVSHLPALQYSQDNSRFPEPPWC